VENWELPEEMYDFICASLDEDLERKEEERLKEEKEEARLKEEEHLEELSNKYQVGLTLLEKANQYKEQGKHNEVYVYVVHACRLLGKDTFWKEIQKKTTIKTSSYSHGDDTLASKTRVKNQLDRLLS